MNPEDSNEVPIAEVHGRAGVDQVHADSDQILQSRQFRRGTFPGNRASFLAVLRQAFGIQVIGLIPKAQGLDERTGLAWVHDCLPKGRIQVHQP